MSKKRSNRNNKKVLKALRQKRANGGRLKAFEGGRFDINDEYIREQIERQRGQTQEQTPEPVMSDVTGSAELSKSNTTSTDLSFYSEGDPKPERSDYRSGSTRKQNSEYQAALESWQSRQNNSAQSRTEDEEDFNFSVPDGDTDENGDDMADEPTPAEIKRDRLADTAKRTEQIATGDPNAPKVFPNDDEL